jgi:hypothetical protein
VRQEPDLLRREHPWRLAGPLGLADPFCGQGLKLVAWASEPLHVLTHPQERPLVHVQHHLKRYALARERPHAHRGRLVHPTSVSMPSPSLSYNTLLIGFLQEVLEQSQGGCKEGLNFGDGIRVLDGKVPELASLVCAVLDQIRRGKVVARQLEVLRSVEAPREGGPERVILPVAEQQLPSNRY